VDARVGHQVCLELGQLHIERTVEVQRGGDGGDNLADEAVEVSASGTLDIQVLVADVIDSLIIHHESAVPMLQGVCVVRMEL